VEALTPGLLLRLRTQSHHMRRHMLQLLLLLLLWPAQGKIPRRCAKHSHPEGLLAS
jgi:hypothetical protein